MWDLTLFLKAEPSVKEFYNKLNGNALLTVIKNIYDEHLYGETANVESFLTALEGIVPYMVDSSLKTALNDQVTAIKSLIAKRIKQSDIDSCLENYKEFYNSLKGVIELNSIKNQVISVFTTNYDIMNEIAMEALNIHYYDGFDGTIKKSFNPSFYNYSYVDRFEYKKSSVRITTNHINLYKLHGSLSWFLDNDGDLIEKNPYDVEFVPEIIYPSMQKFNSTNVVVSFSTLLREFTNNICKDNSSLFVSGTSLGDEHINKIIENALSINTFHMVLFCVSEKDIENAKERYKDYKNVIVYYLPTCFCDIHRVINDSCGLGEEK